MANNKEISLNGITKTSVREKIKSINSKYSEDGTITRLAATFDSEHAKSKEMLKIIQELRADRAFIKNLEKDYCPKDSCEIDFSSTEPIIDFINEFEEFLSDAYRKRNLIYIKDKNGEIDNLIKNFRDSINSLNQQEIKYTLNEYNTRKKELEKVRDESDIALRPIYKLYIDFYRYTIIYMENLLNSKMKNKALVINTPKKLLDKAYLYIFEGETIEESINTQINERYSKEKEAGNIGESKVNYALKWLDRNYSIIERKSKDSYGNDCILIQNSEFNNMSQEFDHIVIGPTGIFLIETKNYSGKLVIDQYGNWKRVYGDEEKGILNPLQQVRRHEKLIKSIVKDDIDIISIVCIANDTAIIDGIENTSLNVIKYDMLVEFIETYKTNKKIIDTSQIQLLENLIYEYMSI